MQFINLITAAAVGLSTFACAAIHERENAIVIVQHLAGVSTSTVYSTSEVTVWACASAATNCPVGSSTSLVSVVTSIVPVSTTICPLTVTSVTTRGTPGTGSTPLSTTTITSTAYQFRSETSVVQTGSTSSGPAASTGSTASGPASSSASVVSSSTGSPVSSSPAPPGVPAQSSGDSTAHSTIHSTLTSISTVTVPAQTMTSVLSSTAGSTLVNATEASVSVSASSATMLPAPPGYGPPAQVTSYSSNEVGGVTGSGGGMMSPTTNGTLATPTLTYPTESFVPFTGGASIHDFERMMVCLVIAVGSAILLV